jgi:hypothetical protein
VRRDEKDPDGGCGCGRAFSGMSSMRATTTAVVRDLDVSLDDVRLAVEGSATWRRSPTSRWRCRRSAAQPPDLAVGAVIGGQAAFACSVRRTFLPPVVIL